MTISRNLDGHDHIRNFENAYVGPGIYVLFDGSLRDSNIVYIGKSSSRVLLRVRAHLDRLGRRSFDRVGLILPALKGGATANQRLIHNLESLVFAEYKDRYDDLPPYNINDAHLLPGSRSFNWHSMRRRKGDVDFK